MKQKTKILQRVEALMESEDMADLNAQAENITLLQQALHEYAKKKGMYNRS